MNFGPIRSALPFRPRSCHSHPHGPGCTARRRHSRPASAQVGGRFDHDVIAAVEEQTPDEIQRLLRAGGDQMLSAVTFLCVTGRMAGDHLRSGLYPSVVLYCRA